MRNNLANQGQAGVGLIDPSNDNFIELYANCGVGIQNFLSKLNSPELFKDKSIRIGLIGDSILLRLDGSSNSIETVMSEEFPEGVSNISYKKVLAAGTGSTKIIHLINDLIGWNPDLIVFGEWENGANQIDAWEEMIRILKEKTSSDIILMPWSMYASDIQLLENNNINGYLASLTYSIRKKFYSIRQKYDLGVYDPASLWINKILLGEEISATLLDDNVHPSINGCTYFKQAFKMQVSKAYLNELNSNNNSKTIETKRLYNAINLPDFTTIIKSGTWEVSEISIDNTLYAIKSSEVGAYLQDKFNGIGFELSYFGDAIGQISIEIDGANPNTLIRDYETIAIRTDSLSSLKVIINSNILSNSESERLFSITMTSATEYTVKDLTNNIVLTGTGNINSDSTFTITGGQLTIPYKYCGIINFDVVQIAGKIFNFSVKKNWYNTIDVTANNLTNVVRIFGLPRGEHTVRLTCNSGTISLDSIMELK